MPGARDPLDSAIDHRTGWRLPAEWKKPIGPPPVTRVYSRSVTARCIASTVNGHAH